VSAADRRLLIGLAGVLVVIFALVGSNVAANHSPKPHDVPIGLVGTPRAIDAVAGPLRQKFPGAYEIHEYLTADAARTAILHRHVYGAYQPQPSPLLMVASAASPSIATLLEQTFRGLARAQGAPAPKVQELVPLPPSDSRGATSFSVVLSLIIASVLGSTVIYLLGRHRPPPVRLAVMLSLAICGGLVTALITNVIVDAFPGRFFGVWAVSSLFMLALGLPISAFQVLIGAAGTAVGAVMFLVIGNPASGGSSAPELLPGFWRALSQILPPGAAVTAMRDVVYFDGHGAGPALLVLAVWALAGIAIVFTVHGIRARRQHAVTSS
jgi:Protein of unknown function (DUF3533)